MATIDVLIIGAGGYGFELRQLLSQDPNYKFYGFIDSKEKMAGLGEYWVGGDEDLIGLRKKVAHAFVAISNPTIKERVYQKLKDLDFVLPSFIHNTAWVAKSVSIGEGTVIYPHATIHDQVEIGKMVLVNSNVSIGHETLIGDFVALSPNVGIAGKVRLGERATVGLGASIIENLSIHSGVTIGAGAAVVRSISNFGIYVGVPARKNQ